VQTQSTPGWKRKGCLRMATVIGDTFVTELEHEETHVIEFWHYMNLACEDHYHSSIVIKSRHLTLEEAQEYTRHRMHELVSQVGGCGFDVYPAEEVDP